MAIECETELSLLKANPYMKQVYRMALEMGKTLIAVSDMYLPEDVIVKALEQNGYTQFTRIFLSQVCGFSKRSGKLFPFVKQEMGEDKRYLHLGDNPIADRVRPRQGGFTRASILTSTAPGTPTAAPISRPLVGSAYRGIVNNRLYSGAYHETPFLNTGMPTRGCTSWGTACGFTNGSKKRASKSSYFCPGTGISCKKRTPFCTGGTNRIPLLVPFRRLPG